jgi:hypothetical protein
MSSTDASTTGPRVLFVYYTYTKQTLKVVETMSEVLRGRGCDVQQAALDLTDKRYTARFHEFPMPHPFRELVAMIPAEIFRKTGEISIPEEAREGNYDLVVIGSPTWWLSTDLPVRSYLESDAAGTVLDGRRFTAFVCCRRYWGHNLRTVKKLGTKKGGTYLDGTHFSYEGGQIRSLLSLLSYMGTGEYREKSHGVKIPPTNIQDYHLEAAREFAGGLADSLKVEQPSPTDSTSPPATVREASPRRQDG